MNNNNEVMSFGSGDVYKSWRTDDRYSGYLSISSACYDTLASPASQPLYVNFRPGSYIIKRESSNQLYAVLPNNTKAKISASVARALYGSKFRTMTVPVNRWGSYVNTAPDITEVKAHEGMLIRRPNDSKIYYVDSGNTLREVTKTGFTANRFKAAFVRSVPSSAVVGYGTGELISGEVTAISDLTQSGGTSGGPSTTSRDLPSFLYVMRTAWTDSVYDNFQLDSIRSLGMSYAQGVPSFFWGEGESGPQGDVMKWGDFDTQMDKLASRGLKTIPFLQTPKLAGLHWDSSILRTDPRYRAEYEEYAYEVVNRYKNHPAWSGIVAIWGGSSDIWRDDTGAALAHNQPEVVIPLLNAAYDGIKRADPNTIVIGFNMGADVANDDWEDWHRRAFALSPKFDWFGVQTHSNPVGSLPPGEGYRGLFGLTNVRRFINEQGYSQKPIFLNEGGFHIFGSIYNEQSQAEQAVETFVAARALQNSVNLKGWVYFTLFGVGDSSRPCGTGNDGDNWGIMSCLVRPGQSGASAVMPQSRVAYRALQTLFSTVNLSAYNYEAAQGSAASNQTSPFVYRFSRAGNPSSKLWVVFSPRPASGYQPVSQNVMINIAPTSFATRIDMFGNQSTAQADANGNIVVQSTASPVYLRVGQ